MASFPCPNHIQPWENIEEQWENAAKPHSKMMKHGLADF